MSQMTKGMECPARELLQGESVLDSGAQSPTGTTRVLHAVTCRGVVFSKGL